MNRVRTAAKVAQPPLISDRMGDSNSFVLVSFHMTVARQETLMTIIVFLEAACKAAELGETGPDHGLESQVGVLPLSLPRVADFQCCLCFLPQSPQRIGQAGSFVCCGEEFLFRLNGCFVWKGGRASLWTVENLRQHCTGLHVSRALCI